MISPIFLEIAVVAIGIFLLLFETFAPDKEKSFLAWLGVAGLGLVLVLSFFTPAAADLPGTAAYWHFYKADTLAMFFKRFALVTTIVAQNNRYATLQLSQPLQAGEADQTQIPTGRETHPVEVIRPRRPDSASNAAG